mmetsp:Transcript_21911/g.66548  ORF Transcript_21911/g.66548 Transcript_21911/m.66548 type:complete len:312 (+) Transcript_21911:47-982(+)
MKAAPPDVARAAPANKEVKRRADGRRLCGSLGCEKEDHHLGPCSTEESESRRSRKAILPYNERKAQERIFYEQIKKPMAKRPCKVKPEEPKVEEPPPVQELLPSGLYRFYDPIHWGVPLPLGAVHSCSTSPEWLQEADKWKLTQTADRIKSRSSVSGRAAQFMILWNEFIHSTDRSSLVSDRCMPRICRSFAHTHAAILAADLRMHFDEHLQTLAAHNLLHGDDVHDCLVIAGATNTLTGDGSKKIADSHRARCDSVTFCRACTRPVHEQHCNLFGKPHGAAKWPILGVTEVDLLQIIPREPSSTRPGMTT